MNKTKVTDIKSDLDYRCEKPRKEIFQQAAGCEAVPDPPFTGRKIIPFPGVSLHGTDCLQDEVDNFLLEMGYTV